MFDGLKDKLNSFTKSVEEEAEEDIDADEETAAADEETADTPSESSSEAETATDTESDVDTSAPAESSVAESTESGTTETESSDSTGYRTDTTDAETAETEAGDSSSRGLMEKAKLAATGKTVIDESDLEGPLEELELALLSSDVEMNVAQSILSGVRENLIGATRTKVKTTGHVVEEALHDALVDVISVGQFDFDEHIAAADKPVTIIFTGVNGVGKTTTIAKLSQYFEDRDFSTVLANGDTYRAGANEQLQQHAANLDKKIISHEQGSDPAAVIYDGVEYAEANDIDVVLGDTAGRLHTSNDLMDQLEKIDRVIDPDMTLFVDEAVAGQDAVNRAQEFNEAAEIDGAVLTKADADPQGGAAISIAHVTGKPILFLGTGQEYDDLEPFDPAVIVDRLLGFAE